jgi:hypothetical protein
VALPQNRDEQKLLRVMGAETANVHLGDDRSYQEMRHSVALRSETVGDDRTDTRDFVPEGRLTIAQGFIPGYQVAERLPQSRRDG